MKKLVIMLVFFLFWVSLVNAIDIDSCGVLDQEGETYVLQNDVEIDGTCFRIGSGVVLDCNDHSITGPNNERENYGVYAGGSRITITNCEITGFGEGISLGYENEAINNNLHGNSFVGIWVGDENTIRGNTITDGVLIGGNLNIIIGNTITRSYKGVLIEGNLNIITDNIINRNRFGIVLEWGPQSNTIVNNIISENSGGIRLDISDYNAITDNHIENNGYGIYLAGGYLNIITNNIINNNNDYGIYLRNGGSNIITDNIANDNNYGLYLEDSDSNNLTSNTFCYNNENDIIIEDEHNEFLYNQFDTIEGLELEGMPCDIESHEIQLNQGWNLISSYLVPYFTDIEAIFGKLARQEKLIIVKDEHGRFFRPENDFNNIPAWNPQEAYQVKVNEPVILTIKGEEHTPLEIPLERGWNFIAYPLTEAMDMEYVIENILSPLIEDNVLDIVKNGRGNFFVPRWDFNNIDEMRPGEGYMVKVTEDSVIDFEE